MHVIGFFVVHQTLFVQTLNILFSSPQDDTGGAGVLSALMLADKLNWRKKDF